MAANIRDLQEYINSQTKDQLVANLGERGMSELMDKLRLYTQEIEKQGWKFHIPTTYQRQFLESFKRLRCVISGNQTGKSLTGVFEDVLFLLGVPHPYKKDFQMRTPCVGWITTQTYTTFYDCLFPYFLAFLPPDSIERVNRLRHDQIVGIDLRNGSSCAIKTYEQADQKIAGPRLDFCHCDEEPKSESYYNELRMRLIRRTGWMWMTITPLKGLSFLYWRLFLNPRQDPELIIFNCETTGGWTIYDNPYLKPEEIERILSDYPDEERDARAYGKFIGRTGIIYPWLQDNRAYCEPFHLDPEHFQFHRVIDPAQAGFTACLYVAVDDRNNLIIFNEYYADRKTVEEHAFNIHMKHADLKFEADWIDPHASQRNMESRGGQTIYEMYRQALQSVGGKIVPLIPAEADVESGIASVWAYMNATRKRVEGKEFSHPYIDIFSNLKYFRWEGRMYQWSAYSAGDRRGEVKGKPRKRNDHLMDCLKYICSAHLKYRIKRPAREIEYVDKITGY